MIPVLADKDLPNIAQFLPKDVKLSFFDSKQPLKQIPDGTRGLLIRTVTKINPETFPDLPESLEFVGTGSSGSDHLDKAYLSENGIVFANALGCNARAVAEYIATALLLWEHEQQYDLTQLSAGIIGVGNAGCAVQDLLNRLDITTIAYDPPREEQDPEFQSASLRDVLDCDILTFHTPLTRNTHHPTFHWLGNEKLADRNFRLIINASRGGVVDEQALIKAHKPEQVENFIMDVWEDEPVFNDETARRAYIKTPHIAGYSRQAKQNASRMIAEALTCHFNIENNTSEPENTSQKQHLPRKFWSLTDVLTYYHPILDYETRFRMLIGRNPDAKKEGFSAIRTGHQLRDEFCYSNIPKQLAETFPELRKLGFGVE